jgi:hypothetical protein
MISSSISFSSCFSVKRCISLPAWCVVSKCWLFSRTLSTWTCKESVLSFLVIASHVFYHWRVELV